MCWPLGYCTGRAVSSGSDSARHLENCANSFLNFFSYSRACFLHSLNIFMGMLEVFTERVASNNSESSILSNSV